jgi:hypothetical protein
VQADVLQQTPSDAVHVTTTFPDLIVLKGAPGVGKTSAACQLETHLSSGVRIEVDVLRRMVVNVDWGDQSEHRKLLLLSSQVAAGFLRLGFAPVVLVDTFSGDKIDAFLAAFRSEWPQGRVFVAVLHASEDVLRERVLRREEGGFRDLTVSMRLNLKAARDLRSFERLIDTSAHSPTEVAQAILAAM